MKSQRQQVEEYLNAEIFGHPSREEQEKIKRLEEMVIQLAGQIDLLTADKKYADTEADGYVFCGKCGKMKEI